MEFSPWGGAEGVYIDSGLREKIWGYAIRYATNAEPDMRWQLNSRLIDSLETKRMLE